MGQKIQTLIADTKQKFGLVEYDLLNYSLHHHVDIYGQTSYTIAMEWLSKFETGFDEEKNPERNAIIDIDFHSGRVVRVIFVGGVSNATYAPFINKSTDEIIDWIEKMTGYTYHEQFQLEFEEPGHLLFRECFNGIPISPSGYIKLKYHESGQLTTFIVHGQFPCKELIKENHFMLTTENRQSIIEQQLTFTTLPSNENKTMKSLYAIEEIFVAYSGDKTYPYEFTVQDKPDTPVHKILSWASPIGRPFVRKPIQFNKEITLEQATNCEPHPSTRLFTEQELVKCIEVTTNFLRQVYPQDSGKWILTTVHRHHHYIQAILKLVESNRFIFKRKLQLSIDDRTYEAINYLDNQLLLDAYDEYKAAGEVLISKEVALEKIKPYIQITPIYVFDKVQKQYILCELIDCHKAIDAESGEMLNLADV
ncbi:hypothetical protein [Solibacillus sp. FSL H8-0538]|uniref:hypothetical protein n=1 Tax=Solibacillus sp. FSL H8-0538 TaxID=2921400 RepID=UPI0030FCC117